MIDVSGSLIDCYIEQVIDDGHIGLLGGPTERCETYGKVDHAD